jgi:small subunit ribosomal protein S17
MKIFSGKIVSKNMQKTSLVVVERVIVHPVYKKRVRLSKRYHVHDETDSVPGQIIKFAACKPYSRTKKWKIVEVEKAAKAEKTEKVKPDAVKETKKENKK